MGSRARRKMRWSDLSTGQKLVTVAVGAAQVSLAVAAWRDLAKRPADRVNGPKAAWAAAIAVNGIGPVLYFTKGRKR